jgi:FkbM family methyltransferase
MQPIDTLLFILNHPISRRHPVAALYRYVNWQVTSRMQTDIQFSWIDGAVLSVRRGMTGATGNIYCGLHEFADMAFLLHLLRPGDLFLDIGANVGTYTILASKVCGARSVAFEPDPITAKALHRNIAINDITDLVIVKEVALSETVGEVAFTVGLDTMNRIARSHESRVQTVHSERLDDIGPAAAPCFAKLDVEGSEEGVLVGATNVLSCPTLLAVQSELDSAEVKKILASFGFQQMFYEPFSRVFSKVSVGYQQTNTLFVRDLQEIERRVREAPTHSVCRLII